MKITFEVDPGEPMYEAFVEKYNPVNTSEVEDSNRKSLDMLLIEEFGSTKVKLIENQYHAVNTWKKYGKVSIPVIDSYGRIGEIVGTEYPQFVSNTVRKSLDDAQYPLIYLIRE